MRAAALLLFVVLLTPIALPVQAAPGVRDFEYVLQPGESLWTISHRLLQDPARYRDLGPYNGLKKGAWLKPGTRVYIPTAWLKMVPLEIEVIHVSGKVQRYLGNAGPAQLLVTGARLSSGDRVETLPNANLSLRLPDGSSVRVAQETDLVVTAQRLPQGKASRIVFNVAKGRVESLVVPRRDAGSNYEIVTPTAHLGVRGTRFEVAFAPESRNSVSQVDEGTVVASNPELAQSTPIEVGAGFGTVIRPGEAPLPPVPQLPAPQLSPAPAVPEGPAVSRAFVKVNGAVAYRIQLARDARFVEILAEQLVGEPSYRFAPLGDGQYFLRVRALDDNGISGREAVTSFQVRDIDL